MTSTSHVETSGSTLIALFVIILAGASILTLLGMGAMMAINAVFSNRPLVTSWPVDQEHAFQPFERHTSASSSRAWLFGLLGAAIVTVAAVGIYFGVPPEHKDMTKGMNMSNLTKKSELPKKPEANPEAKPEAKTDAPKAEAPAEAPKP
jgi:hypothetical protein